MDVNMSTDEEMVLLNPNEKIPGLGTKQNNARCLPFPKLVDDQIYTQHVEIDHLKKPQLMDLCREFQLPVSGNMQVLRERLEEFSNSLDKWERLGGHARRSHLGPHSGKVPKVSAPKKSTLRRTEMFENPISRPFPRILSTAVPEQRWNQAQHTADMNWALHIMNLYPYRVEETRMRLAAAAAQEAGQLSRGSSVDYDNLALKTGLETANTNISKLLEAFRDHPAPPHPSPSVSIKPDVHQPIGPFVPSNTSAMSTTFFGAGSACKPNNMSHPPSPKVGGASIVSQAAPKILTRSIVLAHGRTLEFNMDDVPAPPALSFAKDIPSLNRMWDDTTKYWDGHSKLVIRGIAIPIVYWKAVYTSKPTTEWLPKHWESLKGKWFDWKILVERWRKGTPERFWEEFSENGEPLGYKTILKRLAEQRASEERASADKIIAEFGDQFSTLFSYVKKGQTYVKVKPCHIIKQYRKMKGLSNNSSNGESNASDSE